MEIVIIYRELIKPSSPTPTHLKTYKISLLDQYVPNCYVPLLAFYGAGAQSSVVSQVLKQSLSKTLTLYYPLAGQAKDKVSIDCNDNGALYAEAKAVNCNLHCYLSKPDLSTLYKFLPGEIASFSAQQVTSGSHLLLVNCTHFVCGGFALGFFVSHALFDAVSVVTFFKTWASIARQFSHPEHHHLSPNFDGRWMFPQTIEFPQELTTAALAGLLVRKEKFVLKRFVFDGSVIKNLKAKSNHNPSRVEVVSFILHKRIMTALTVRSGTCKSSWLGIRAINLRRKAVPELPYTSVGNFVWLVGTTYNKEESKDLSSYIKHTRKAISGINGEFVDGLKGDKGMEKLCEEVKELSELYVKAVSDGAEAIITFNSWCNTGIYDADFGWGKPLWLPLATSMDILPINTIQLIDTRGSDGGIEAWMTLDEESMNVLECDEELRSLGTFDPSPLQISFFKSNL